MIGVTAADAATGAASQTMSRSIPMASRKAANEKGEPGKSTPTPDEKDDAGKSNPDLLQFAAGLLLEAIKEHLPVIIVFAEWANVDGKAAKNEDIAKAKTWLKELADVGGLTRKDAQEPTAMSKLTPLWVFPIQREFNSPYNKRTYLTNATDLTKGSQEIPVRWVDMTVAQVKKVLSQASKGCRLALQIQPFGGEHSRYRNNDLDNKTSYSWRRDTTVVQVMDVFYESDGSALDKKEWPKHIARDWQEENDDIFVKQAVFGKGVDRRVLWGSYHATMKEKNMGNAWRFYHEDEQKYARLCEIKQRVDPLAIFSPNEFSVNYPADPVNPVAKP